MPRFSTRSFPLHHHRRIDVTLLGIDIAQTKTGDWTVIEINDGQDSGYAGVNPMLMWRNILDHQTPR